MNGLYEITEIVSSDDYSITCTARDRGALAGRRTHLKVLKEGLQDGEIVSRMRDEARVLSRLRHPGMVHLFGLHSYRGRPVLEMEFLRGRSVAQLLEAGGPLPAEAAIQIARSVAGALDAAYNRPVGPGGQPMRIVHRNVSLPNILVTVGGAVKVVDFVMAKGSYADRLAISFVAPATARGYPAPELADDASRATEAGDVYSLGHCVYHMVTGRRLNLVAVEAIHERDATAALDGLVLSDLPRPLSDRVVALLRRMLRFDAAARPTHREVVEALGEIVLHARWPADLARFGEDVVAPQHEMRERVPPSHHPLWSEVAFLEEMLPDVPESDEEITPAQAAARMHEITREPGWSRRLPEIQDLVVASGYRPAEPFLPTLDRALSPTWKFWEKAPDPADVCAALAMVVQIGTPEVLTRAKALLSHRNEDVRHAARFVVAQYEDV